MSAITAVVRRLPRRLPSIGRRRTLLLVGFAAVLTTAVSVMTGVLPWPLERNVERTSQTQQRSATDEPATRNADHTLERASSPPSIEPGGLPWGRRIIRRANLEVELSDVDRGIARLTAAVDSLGGYVADTQTHTDAEGTVQGVITAYVPPELFSRAVDELAALGRVTSRRIAGQDVSEEFVDLEARVRNLEWHETQLRSIMAKAQKVADLLTVENELARVRGEIERLTGRVRFLKARSELATIQVNLTRLPLTGPADGVTRLLQEVRAALRDGWYGAFHVTTVILVFIAQMSPLIIPALGAWVIYRRWVGRRTLTPPPSGGTVS